MMRVTGGLVRQSAADGLRKRSPIGTRRKSRVRKPGFCVGGVGVATPDNYGLCFLKQKITKATRPHIKTTHPAIAPIGIGTGRCATQREASISAKTQVEKA